jgi:hypothetical protein
MPRKAFRHFATGGRSSDHRHRPPSLRAGRARTSPDARAHHSAPAPRAALPDATPYLKTRRRPNRPRGASGWEKSASPPRSLITGALARLTGRRRRVKARRDGTRCGGRNRSPTGPQQLEGASLTERRRHRRRGVPLPRASRREVGRHSFYGIESGPDLEHSTEPKGSVSNPWVVPLDL